MDITAPMAGPGRETGFTLVEMVTTLAIASILLTTGIPEFKQLIAGNQLTTEINTMVTHLHLARSEAVKLGKRAVLCPSSNGTQCLPGTNWDQGYLLFVDNNADREYEDPEPKLRYYQKAQGDTRISSTTGRRRITYRPDGSATGSNLTLTFCNLRGSVPPKAVIVSNTGRPRVSTTRADGTPLLCK